MTDTRTYLYLYMHVFCMENAVDHTDRHDLTGILYNYIISSFFFSSFFLPEAQNNPCLPVELKASSHVEGVSICKKAGHPGWGSFEWGLKKTGSPTPAS